MDYLRRLNPDIYLVYDPFTQSIGITFKVRIWSHQSLMISLLFNTDFQPNVYLQLVTELPGGIIITGPTVQVQTG